MTTLASASRPTRRGVFAAVWAGQVISTIGSGLSGFALGLWVLQQTGQVTPFALITCVSTLPGLLLAPVTGAVIDRYNRRTVMLLSDLGAALCTLALWLIFRQGVPRLGWITLAVTLSASLSAIQVPAYAAATTQMVARGSLGRISGLVQLGQSVSQILSPALAGVLVLTIGVPGILMLDLISFLFAAGTLALIRLPDLTPPPTSLPDASANSWLHKLRADASQGWSYLTTRPGLVGLTFFMLLVNFMWGMVRTLIAPLILGFGSSATLGALISVAGTGLLAGSLALSAWGGPRRKISGVLAFELLSGVAFVIIGARPLWISVAAGVLMAHFSVAMVQGCNRAFWQTAVPEALQGRVLSIQSAIAHASVPIAALIAGPLADRIFEPAMSSGGALAPALAPWVGSGTGRGVAVIFLLMGLLKVGVSLWGMAWPRLSHMKD